MRRRSRMKSLKILHPLSQGRIVASLILFFCSYIIAEPGYLDFDNLPETNFTCAGKVIGGYYADLEASCQMFHVCTIGQLDEPMDIKFLCLNGTVFDQETRVCERVDEVDCSKSEKFYYLNLELYGNTMVPVQEEESSEDASSPSTKTTTTTSTSTTPSSTTTNHLKTSTTPITTRKLPQTTTPYTPTLPIYYYNNTLAPEKSTGYSSTTVHSPTHYVSSTTKSLNDDVNEDEYEYEDDYITSDQESESPKPTPNSGIFSPQQFIYRQNSGKSSLTTEHKPAISFQQQQFQNGDSLSVTNSHVTVTTHSAPVSNGNKNSQFINRNNENSGFSSSTTNRPQFNLYTFNTQPPKRIPLLPISNQQNPPSGHPGLQQLTPYRLRAQGFKLPQQHQPQPFEGYRRQTPQVPTYGLKILYDRNYRYDIPLNLPFEHRNQKEILGFEDNSADDLILNTDHKELKRSDPNASSTEHRNSTVTSSQQRNVHHQVEHEKPNVNINNGNDENSNSKILSNKEISLISNYRQSNSHNNYNLNSSSNNNNNTYDNLLTPQNRYISNLPKVIITASASVSDASGKKLSYSVGNVLGNNKNIKAPPSTYDEYKEDDVVLDPFFLDVPKIVPRHRRSIKSNLFV